MPLNQNETRRNFIKKATYVAPIMLALGTLSTNASAHGSSIPKAVKASSEAPKVNNKQGKANSEAPKVNKKQDKGSSEAPKVNKK